MGQGVGSGQENRQMGFEILPENLQRWEKQSYASLLDSTSSYPGPVCERR